MLLAGKPVDSGEAEAVSVTKAASAGQEERAA
jgi:hypothetical protein